MKLPLFLLLTFTTLAGIAQPATSSMVDAEKSFAARSVKDGTRPAFLAFMDTSAIMYRNDSFVNGYQMWLAKPARPGILNWNPVVAELSMSGNWGFTTGPWTFRMHEKDTAAGRGHFFTIWQKDNSGQWKFIFDCGTDTGAEGLEALYSFQVPKTPGTKISMMQAERDFITRMLSSTEEAHRQYLSVSSVLCRNGQSLAITPGQQNKLLRGLPANIQSIPAGQFLSPAADMGLAYGTLIVDGKPKPWLRLWRHERGGWRLAAEVLPL